MHMESARNPYLSEPSGFNIEFETNGYFHAVRHGPNFAFRSNDGVDVVQQDAGGNLLTPFLNVGSAYYLRKFNARV